MYFVCVCFMLQLMQKSRDLILANLFTAKNWINNVINILNLFRLVRSFQIIQIYHLCIQAAENPTENPSKVKR